MNKEISNFLNTDIKKLKIAVFGDIMLGRYLTGVVERISPEAPVPINRIQNDRSVLGGAANTAANLSTLGCQVHMVGRIGNDQAGKNVRKLLHLAGINDEGVIVSDNYSTISKIRILSGCQQMMRLDFENIIPLQLSDKSFFQRFLNFLAKSGLNAFVISDYGKGVVNEEIAQFIIHLGSDLRIPVVVDPKGSDWTKYRGAYSITPNVKELSDCVGHVVPNDEEKVCNAGSQIREKYGIKRLYITRSEKGITSLDDRGICTCKSAARDVYDVSGAGDTVVAVVAAASANHMDIHSILSLANIAAGIAVSKVGTYQVRREELITAIEERNRENEL